MTAPAAPIIYADQFGGLVLIRWRPVDTATDYNVYLGSDPAPAGLEDSVADEEAEPNGWFRWYSGVQVGQVFIQVTALNVGAEESDRSNQRYLYMTSASDQEGSGLTPAADINRKL